MANSLISMIKGDSTLINNTEVLDGQVLFNTDEKTILLDDDNTRTKYCGADKSNKNLAPIENGNTATRGYSAGSYVVWKEQLYKVLTQINSGTAFVVGTNIVADTVGAELTQINSDLPLTHSHREMSNGRTCAQIFGALATVLNSLTEQEKIGAKLVYGNTASVNRGVWSLKGMSAQGGIFSVTEATYSAGNTSYILGGTEASISTDSAQCYQVTEKVAASTVSGAVSNIASAKIESSDVIGSVSDTHYYELVW